MKYITIFLILFSVLTGCSKSKKYSIQFIEYDTHLIEKIVSDSTNIFLLENDYENKKVDRNNYKILDSTITWTENRFHVHFRYKLMHSDNECNHGNPYSNNYIFKGDLDTLLTSTEKEKLESLTRNSPKEKIETTKSEKFELVSGNQFNSLIIGLGKPIYYKEKNLLFIDYNVYLSYSEDSTDITKNLYSYNFLIMRLENNEWKKIETKTHFIL